jgi:2'-5' RNA ligase superfamily
MKQGPFYKILSCLAVVLFSSAFKYASEQSAITAIDVLLDPDKTMLDSAKTYNKMMLKNYSGSGSYSLDVVHTPHITVFQCFVKTADLEKVYAVVAQVVKNEKPTEEKLTSKGFYYLPTNGLGLAGITINTTPGLLHFQSKIIDVLKPFIVVGTDAAFVQNENRTAIAAGSSEYVNGFITDHAGNKYNPHVTIGLARESYLKELIAKPYQTFSFKCLAVSIYQLGDFGTARKKLWTSRNNN